MNNKHFTKPIFNFINYYIRLFNPQVYEGTILRELQKFKHYLTKRGNAYKHNNVDKMLEVYSWFVLPQYRSKGLLLINLLSNLLLLNVNKSIFLK